jgi:hypothetical protein
MTTQLLEPVLQQTTSHTAFFDSSQHNTDPINNHAPLTPVATNTKATMRTWRFWAIIVSLMVTGLVSALEGTIITSALPGYRMPIYLHQWQCSHSSHRRATSSDAVFCFSEQSQYSLSVVDYAAVRVLCRCSSLLAPSRVSEAVASIF